MVARGGVQTRLLISAAVVNDLLKGGASTPPPTQCRGDSMSRVSKFVKKTRELRARVWPEVNFQEELWHRKLNDGFITVPRTKSWLHKTGQGDKWIFCLTAARMAAIQERK
jgi:hypothetical protein